MLRKLGIESPLQLAVMLCVTSLIVVTTLGGSGGAPEIFFTYRTMLAVVAILCAIGCHRADVRISRWFLGLVAFLLFVMFVSVLRIQGSHFDSLYLSYRYTFFICAFVSLAHYNRYQSAAWKGWILASVITVNLIHLIPDLLMNRHPVKGFSLNNADYFATFLLIGLACSVAAAIYGIRTKWRIGAALSAVVLLLGVVQTLSRAATLAIIAIITIAAIRSRKQIPRHVWLFAGLVVLVVVVIVAPQLVSKFLLHGESDPYNYARIQIWLSSLRIIAEHPVLGVGLGQFSNVSKRFAFPVDGQVARYMVRIGMAHSEYLQHAAEIGIPAAVLLFLLLAYLLYQISKRSHSVGPEYRCFHEAALLTAVGLGTHALVDNCWTIPVTASGLIVLSLADPLPLEKKIIHRQCRVSHLALAGALILAIYIHAVAIPGLALYYNDRGHKAYDNFDFKRAEKYHLKALAIVPDHAPFLDNLGMVYLDKAIQAKDAHLLELSRIYFARAAAANPLSLDPLVHMEAALTRSTNGDSEHDSEIYHRIIETDMKLLSIDPFIPFVRKNLAGALYTLGNREQALRELQTAIEYEPNYVPGYMQFATWYEDLGDTSSSEQYTAKAIAIVNKYRDARLREPYEKILLGRPLSTAESYGDPR